MASLTADLAVTADSTESGPVRSNGTLSESEIVEAALRVVRTDGVAKLSMRRLSRELGVSPMAPYYYVADKRELLDLVASAALAGVSPAPSGSWQQRLRQMIDQIDERLRKHPGLGDVLIEGMLRKQLDLISAMMGILSDAGFADREILSAYATVHTYLFGRGRLTPSHPDDFAALPVPAHVRRATAHLTDLRGKYFYDFAVETIIAGLEARLAQQHQPVSEGAAIA